MKSILALVRNDLKRDWKRPWSILLLAALPLVMSALMAAVFAGGGGTGPMPTLHVAVLDRDKDMLSGVLRSLPTQGEAAQRLRLQFVDDRAQGLRLLERGKASALVILPLGMTERLLRGQTNAIELYENPAERILPKVVREGVSLLAVLLSAGGEVLHEPLTEIRSLLSGRGLPTEDAVVGAASNSMRNLSRVRSYVFPPLITFETVSVAEYEISATHTMTPTEPQRE